MSLALDAELAPRPLRPPGAAAYSASLAMVVAAAGLAAVVEQIAPAPNLSLVFVLPVVVAAVSYGFGPALAAAVGGVLAYNFLFLPPRFTLRVADPANVWAMLLLLIIAAVVSAVAASARRRAAEAGEAADRAVSLQRLAQSLVAAEDRQEIAQACADALSRLFRAPAAVYVQSDDALELAAAAGERPGPADAEAAAWALAARLPTRGGAYPIGEAVFDLWPTLSAKRQGAVVGVRLASDHATRPANPERLVDVVAGYLTVALDREALARQAVQTQVQAVGEQLKADILAAVSHDLKTPLSTMLVTLESLRLLPHAPKEREELLHLAEQETARLGRLVDELLDMSRLDAGAVVPRAGPWSAVDLVQTALARCGPSPLRVLKQIDPDLQLLVDPTLFATALAAVLENAGKYAPAGSTLELSSGVEDDRGWIEVRDEGQGFGGEAERLTRKFVRGVEGDGRPPGLGLGLPIARGFLEAMGGRLEAGDRTDRSGAWVRLWAPLP